MSLGKGVGVYEQVVKRFNAKSRRGKDAKKFLDSTTPFAPSLLGDFALKKNLLTGCSYTRPLGGLAHAHLPLHIGRHGQAKQVQHCGGKIEQVGGGELTAV